MRVARLTASPGDHPDQGVLGIEQFVGVVFNICVAAPRRPNRRPREVRILIVLPVVNRTFSCLLKKRPPDLASFVASRPMGGSYFVRVGSLPFVAPWSPSLTRRGLPAPSSP